jgi:hypothetical protein
MMGSARPPEETTIEPPLETMELLGDRLGRLWARPSCGLGCSLNFRAPPYAAATQLTHCFCGGRDLPHA